MSTKRLPQNLLEATRYFSDDETCVQFVASLRWANGPVCPKCGGIEHSYLTTRRVWKCKNKECRKQFSVKVGTIFEDSPIPLDKWLCAIWLIANAKNGISSHELGRSVGITQKSAWFVLHRIRLAMQVGNFDRFDGEVEADETFVGGKAGNMHKAKRREVFGEKKADSPARGKTVVAGVLQRGEVSISQVTAVVVPDRDASTIQDVIRETVEPGSTLYTDKWHAYRALGDEYDHESIDHLANYVDGKIHTQGIENFWALLKRGLKGTYVYCNPEHLFRYVDERAFTFNERDNNDLGRFAIVVAAVSGRRLTYSDLTSG